MHRAHTMKDTMTAIDMRELVTILSALGCGLIAGTFFAFSAFVMKALGRLPAEQGIAAMQSINIVVINRWFMGAFFGTALACLAAATAGARLEHAATAYLIAGSVLYVTGTIGVTMACNVPRNDALASLIPSAPQAALWQNYLSTWTAWNTVRTVAAFAASAAFILALRVS